MASSRRSILFAAAGGALQVTACSRKAEPRTAIARSFHATDITGAEFARRLELPDVDGKPRTLADGNGKVIVVFFGYTQCPDVCPTTMAELMQIRQRLGANADKLQHLRDRGPRAGHP